MNKDYGKQAILQNIKLVVTPNGVYGFDQDSVSEALDKYAKVYYEGKTIELWQQTPSAWVSSPVKEARKIALDAAIQLSSHTSSLITFGDDSSKPSPTVTLAEEIYQWLIKEDQK